MVFLVAVHFLQGQTLSAMGRGPREAAELTTFVEQEMARLMDVHQTQAAAVVVIGDGRILLQRGFGFVDGAETQPVDAGTGFRIASVSKVFVGLAAAMMIERGDLVLEQPVNEIVTSFALSEPFAEPLRLRHLLAHTGGFDEQFWGDLTLDPAQRQPLGVHLAHHLPPRVLPPGHMVAYSNYGYSLAAYCVEQAAGTPFHQWVHQEILLPMGMQQSGFLLHEDRRSALVTGHRNDGTPRPYTYVHRYPATSMITNARDMARFMTTVLNRGRVEDRTVYGTAAADLLEQALYQPHPSMPGQTAGFMQWRRWGHRILWHDGAHVGYSAELMLFPDLNSGFFIVANKKGGDVTAGLKYALLKRYYKPENPQTLTPPYRRLTDHQALAGSYQNSRRSRRNLAKARGLFGGGLTVTAQPDGTLGLLGLSFAEIEPDLFAYVARPDMRLAVKRKADGSVDHLAVDYGGAPRAYQPQRGIDHVNLHRVVLAGCSLFWFGWVLLGTVRLRRGIGGPRRAFETARLVFAALNGGFLFAFAGRMATIDPLTVRAGAVPALTAILALPLAALPVLVVVLLTGLRLWRMGQAPSRRGTLAFLFVAVLYYGELVYWHLLGFWMTA